MNRLTLAIPMPMSLASLSCPGKHRSLCQAIAEEQRVRGLGPDGDLRVSENEIRKLCEAVQRDRIGAIQFHVALDVLQSLADVLHACIVIRLRGRLLVINTARAYRGRDVLLFGR